MSDIPDRLIARVRTLLASSDALIELQDYESAVSRAYYAMFHAARAALLTKRLTPKSHKGVLALFSEQFVQTGAISPEDIKALRNAFSDRSLADYGDDASFTEEQVRRTLNRAGVFVDHVEALVKA